MPKLEDDFEILAFNERLSEIIDQFPISIEEKEYRKKQVSFALTALLNDTEKSNRYFNLAHEVLSLHFLENFGSILISSDKHHQVGPDVRIGKYFIECVCSSKGNIVENGLCKFTGSGTFDVSIKYRSTLPRITSSLVEKSRKLNEYRIKGIIPKDSPIIIFLGMGSLKQYLRLGEHGQELNRVLIGKGDMQLQIDRETMELIKVTYSNNEKIIKHNSSEITAKFFMQPENEHIDGILISTAHLFDDYNKLNTFLFINPNSKNEIDIRDFKDVYYWKTDQASTYCLYRNSERIEEKPLHFI